MHRGYIRLWRKIAEWGWYKDANTLAVFIHLLLKANHKDTIYQGHVIPRGSCVCGRFTLAEDTGLSEQSLRTSFRKLKSTNDITIKSTNKFSIVCIVNYEEYQPESTSKSTSKLTNNQPTTNQQLTTSKECKEYKNKDISTKEPFKQPTLEEVKTYALEISAGIDAAAFIDHYTSVGWRIGKAPMKDWRATVRTWKRRNTPQASAKQNPNKKFIGVT